MPSPLGFKGFSYESPQEIMARFKMGIQSAVQSGNKDAARMAIASQAGALLGGGPPGYREARKKDTTLRQASKKAQARADAMGITDPIKMQQMYFQEAQRAAIDAGLTDVAMQATAQLASIDQMQFERKRLKAADIRAEKAETRAATAEERAAASFEIQNEVDKVTGRHLTNGMLVDPETLEVEGVYDLTDSAQLSQMGNAKDERNELTFVTEAQYLELTEAEKDRKARQRAAGAGWEGRSTLYKDFYKKMQTVDSFAIVSDDFVDLLLSPESTQMFAAGGDLKGGLEKAAFHARSLLGAGHESLLNEDFERFGNSQTLKDAGVNWNALTSDKKALIMELGYSLATTREGGRLTDQDVERAILSLGVDNPDPRAIAWVFGRSLKRTRDQWAGSLRNSGLKDLDAVNKDHQATLDALNFTLGRMEENFQVDFEDLNSFQNYTTGPTRSTLGLDDDGVKVGTPFSPSQSPKIIQVP